MKGRDVRRAIPKGFPYFSVDFGSSPGYAHVIEEEASFPTYFGQVRFISTSRLLIVISSYQVGRDVQVPVVQYGQLCFGRWVETFSSFFFALLSFGSLLYLIGITGMLS